MELPILLEQLEAWHLQGESIFVAMPGLSETDISDVCRANGVEGLREIETVKKDCEGDLRRVKRKCHAFNRMRRQAEERKEETAE